jgi:hypothetical protein
MLREFTAFFNKQYRDSQDGPFLLKAKTALLQLLRENYAQKSLPSHMFFADDCFVVFRNLGFMNDEYFQLALATAKVDQVLLARIWRVWTLCWSMHLRWSTKGCMIDCGTYNGVTLEVALRYSSSKLGSRGDSILACDLFDDPPDEARKADHGPHLHQAVATRLAPLGSVKVLKGRLPDSLIAAQLTPVTWCHIDLNSADADGETFKYILPKLTDGATVVFDDYGSSRYAETQKRLDSIAELTGSRILELPTGQGLYIHQK